MKVILIIALLCAVTLSADTTLAIKNQYPTTNDTKLFVTPITAKKTQTVTSFVPNAGVQQTLLFWFKPATPTTTASATAAAANIFRFFNTAAPTADFINVYVEIAADKYVIGVKAKTTTGSATDDSKFEIAFTDSAKIAKWTLVWIVLDASAANTLATTWSYNATAAKTILAANFKGADTAAFDTAEFLSETPDAAKWGAFSFDGFRQYLGKFDAASLVCTDAQFTSGVYSLQPCTYVPPTTTTTTTTKSSGSYLYVSLFIIMIIISILF